MAKRGQSSIEAALLITFMLLVLVIFLGIMTKKGIALKKASEKNSLNNIADVIKYEVFEAQKAEDGYNRELDIPESVDGIPFRATIISSSTLNANFFELIINATKYRKDLILYFTIKGKAYGKLCHKTLIRKFNKTVVFQCGGS